MLRGSVDPKRRCPPSTCVFTPFLDAVNVVDVLASDFTYPSILVRLAATLERRRPSLRRLS
ncbi:hypothetical protein ACU4GD_14390 [Cupriavidus basilensis]